LYKKSSNDVLLGNLGTIFYTGSIGPEVKTKKKIKSKCGMARGPDRRARVNDSWNRAALERCIVTDRRWKMNDPSRLSLDI